MVYYKISSFKITQNYIIVSLKIIRRKETSKINQSLTCKHKININIPAINRMPKYLQIIELFALF